MSVTNMNLMAFLRRLSRDDVSFETATQLLASLFHLAHAKPAVSYWLQIPRPPRFVKDVDTVLMDEGERIIIYHQDIEDYLGKRRGK